MITSAQTRPEPMNSSPLHSKVKVSMTLANTVYVAGNFVAGKMEVECRADKGLGIGIIMVELFAVQELTSRDHSTSSTFLHSRRLFQGPDLPPSNAVQAHPLPGEPPYPPHYHQALRGISKFLFRIPLPSSAPSSISFGSDLARVRYELRATVGVMWKGEKTLVVCKREIDVVESFEVDFARTMPVGIVVGEFGKIWVQGSVVGGMIIAGESACLELQVKNHSNKRNTGLTLSLTRLLVLPGPISSKTSLLQIFDNLATVSFRGPDYIITPGAEGVASLVFDVPNDARGVRAGPYEGGDLDHRSSESIFEVRCILGISIDMEPGTQDIHLDIPVTVVHPDAVPEPAEFTGYSPPEPVPLPQHLQSLYDSGLPFIPGSYINSVQNRIWLPPYPSHMPHNNDIRHLSPQIDDADPQYHSLPSPHADIPYIQTRPFSTEPTDHSLASYKTGSTELVPPLTSQPLPNPFDNIDDIEPEEGKGERATRISQHLRMSSRNRSVSPSSHRSPFPTLPTGIKHISPSWADVDPSSNSPKTRFEAGNFEAVPALSPVDPAQVQGSPVTEPDISKTLPIPPPVANKTKKAKDKETMKSGSRTRIDEFFVNASPMPTELKAPKTPLAAVTPVKVPLKPKSAEFGAQPQANGQAESGLDALEKRLLAGVGTRKMDLASEQLPAWSIIGAKPIDIPSKGCVPDDPMNESAISSLTLAGERFDREVELNGILDDVEHDSDEKTHRAGKSTASAGSRKGSKDKGEKGKKRGKKDKDKDKDRTQDQGKDGEGHHGRKKKTAAAAKGRVAAWLGAIDPDVPPVEDVLPPSPAVSRNFSSFMESKEVPLPIVDSDVASSVSRPLSDIEWKYIPPDDASAPNSRSSGFVPIDIFKSGILPPFKPLLKDATVVREARRVADIWSASTCASTAVTPLMVSPLDNMPLLNDVPPAFASSFLVRQVAPSNKATPLSTASAADILEAQYYNIDAGKVPNMELESPNSNKTTQTSHLAALCTPQDNPEARYNVQSVRGGRGGRVTAISSFLATGAVGPSLEPTTNPAPFKPLRNCAPDPGAISAKSSFTSISPTLPEQSFVKSLLADGAQMILLLNHETKPVDFAGKRPRAIVKSTSVPAIISSSHATPMLSSTASLARPTHAKAQAPTPPVISEAQPDPGRQTLGQTLAKYAISSSQTGTAGRDMAFGQARLRDLIKKYQGHAV